MSRHSRRSFFRVSGLTAAITAIGRLTANAKPLSRAPALFVGHGSPMNAISDSRFTRAWATAASGFPKPSAIVSISAHWLTRGTYVTQHEHPPLQYDMYGFPKALYEIEYAAPGMPALAQELSELAHPTDAWGLDHGTWSVLVHLYPEADVPVVQLSIDGNHLRGLDQYLAYGAALAKLRNQGVMILGSGNLIHNLRRRRVGADPPDWALAFDGFVTDRVDQRDFAAVADLASVANIARLAHPTVEHYIPLLYVLGAADENEPISWFGEGFDKSTIGMRCLRVG